MKALVTAVDVKDCAAKGKQQLVLENENTIITPAARDAARDLGIEFVIGSGVQSLIKANADKYGVDPRLVAVIVREVLAQLPGIKPARPHVVEEDVSGIRLVRGNTVVYDPFDTGKPGDKVGLKDLLTLEESPRIGAGFITMEKSAFDWELKYDEYDYIVEGQLDITVNGKTYRGQAGDVFYIPKDTQITFATPDRVKFFYVTYPADWQAQLK